MSRAAITSQILNDFRNNVSSFPFFVSVLSFHFLNFVFVYITVYGFHLCFC